MADPIILYDTILDTGTVTATDTASGYSVDNLSDLRPYTTWKAASSGDKDIDVDFGSAVTVDMVGIGPNHNLETVSAQLIVYSSTDDITYARRSSNTFFPAPDNKPFLVDTTLLGTVSARYWRVRLTSTSAAAEMGVLLMGAKLAMPKRPRNPVRLLDEGIVARGEISKSGHLLGVTNRYNPIKVNLTFNFLTHTFVYGDYQTFWDSHGKLLKPFFFALDLDNFATDVFFVRFTAKSRFAFPQVFRDTIQTLTIQLEGVSV